MVKMGVSQSDTGRMEGWLYLIRSNRIGLQYSRKRYFILQDHLLKSFKSVPLTPDEVYLVYYVVLMYSVSGFLSL